MSCSAGVVANRIQETASRLPWQAEARIPGRSRQRHQTPPARHPGSARRASPVPVQQAGSGVDEGDGPNRCLLHALLMHPTPCIISEVLTSGAPVRLDRRVPRPLHPAAALALSSEAAAPMLLRRARAPLLAAAPEARLPPSLPTDERRAACMPATSARGGSRDVSSRSALSVLCFCKCGTFPCASHLCRLTNRHAVARLLWSSCQTAWARLQLPAGAPPPSPAARPWWPARQ